MIFFDGDGLGAAILLVFVLGALGLLLVGAQILRAFLLPGWRGLLYPTQSALSIATLAFGQSLVWLLPIVALVAFVLAFLTRREDPDLGWFALLGGGVTVACCALAYLTI